MTEPAAMDITHFDDASGLTYRVRKATGRARARLFLLHGVGGNETNLMPLADALPSELELVFVRGPITLAPGQHAWFQVRFGAEGPLIHAEQANDSRLRLGRLVRSLRGADADALLDAGGEAQSKALSEAGNMASSAPAIPALMAGFSQGGILSASVALTLPDDVSRFAVLCGRILPEIEPHLAAREQLALVAGFIAHGEYDDKLPVHFAERASAWLTQLEVPHVTRLYPAGHTLTGDMVRDWTSWLVEQLAQLSRAA